MLMFLVSLGSNNRTRRQRLMALTPKFGDDCIHPANRVSYRNRHCGFTLYISSLIILFMVRHLARFGWLTRQFIICFCMRFENFMNASRITRSRPYRACAAISLSSRSTNNGIAHAQQGEGILVPGAQSLSRVTDPTIGVSVVQVWRRGYSVQCHLSNSLQPDTFIACWLPGSVQRGNAPNTKAAQV